jgi:ABC-2 type transport system ATP-binding protein
MSQRLGIAAAILGNPKYLLLDEPANGLDPEGIAWLRKFLEDYADTGNAVFVSSHLLSEMSQMADNIVVIGKGKLIANTSIEAITQGAHGNGVFVRTAGQKAMQTALKAVSRAFVAKDNGLLVSGTTTDEVGKIAFKSKIEIHELTTINASLEEAFLELTADSQEYKTGTKKDKN